MPAHQGQTYDRQEEPPPRGGWFRLVDRPYPERLDRGFRVAAIVVAMAADAAFVTYMNSISGAGLGPIAIATAVAIGLIPAAMAYGFTRAIGMIVVGVYGTLRDGSEFMVDWRAVRHDLLLRRTWILILEGALLLAAPVGSVWGFLLFIRQGSTYGLAMGLLVQVMTYWPMIRRRIASGRAEG